MALTGSFPYDEKAAMGAANPLEVRVIEQRDDGSAIVEIPLLVNTPKLDLSKTEGGGKKTISFGETEFKEMVANFASWPKPVALGFDGMDGHVDQRGGPQLAFVNHLRVSRGKLLATVDLAPLAAQMVVHDRAYRATSVEARRNPVTPTGRFVGWAVTGGIFTNNPATDTQFRIAAATEIIESDLTVQVTTFPSGQQNGPDQRSTDMSDHSVAKVEADLKLAEVAKKDAETKLSEATEKQQATNERLSAALGQVEELTVELGQMKATAQSKTGEAQTLKTKVDEMERQIAKLTGQISEQKDKELVEEIQRFSKIGLERGMLAAFFEGQEKDYLAWFRAKGFNDISAFESMVKAIPEGTKVSATSSGKSKQDKTDDKADDGLSDEHVAKLKELGIDPKFASIDNENDLKALREKEKADK